MVTAKLAQRVISGVGRRLVGKDFADLMALGAGVVKRANVADGVALTFDDSPNQSTTEGVLASLRVARIKATFFCVGDNAVKWPELLRQIAKEGHEIGNHSMAHPHMYAMAPR